DIEYFALDNVKYHGHFITIFYDKTGKHYGKGIGFHVLIDGKEKFSSENLPEKQTTISLNYVVGLYNQFERVNSSCLLRVNLMLVA
ncbi:MAG: hypothetical protein LBJ67_07630, partial [Planctomycetaceae bacterium]|nr:hypothetical protein [Planctomycetaceae bacterium]